MPTPEQIEKAIEIFVNLCEQGENGNATYIGSKARITREATKNFLTEKDEFFTQKNKKLQPDSQIIDQQIKELNKLDFSDEDVTSILKAVVVLAEENYSSPHRLEEEIRYYLDIEKNADLPPQVLAQLNNYKKAYGDFCNRHINPVRKNETITVTKSALESSFREVYFSLVAQLEAQNPETNASKNLVYLTEKTLSAEGVAEYLGPIPLVLDALSGNWSEEDFFAKANEKLRRFGFNEMDPTTRRVPNFVGDYKRGDGRTNTKLIKNGKLVTAESLEKDLDEFSSEPEITSAGSVLAYQAVTTHLLKLAEKIQLGDLNVKKGALNEQARSYILSQEQPGYFTFEVNLHNPRFMLDKKGEGTKFLPNAPIIARKIKVGVKLEKNNGQVKFSLDPRNIKIRQVAIPKNSKLITRISANLVADRFLSLPTSSLFLKRLFYLKNFMFPEKAGNGEKIISLAELLDDFKGSVSEANFLKKLVDDFHNTRISDQDVALRLTQFLLTNVSNLSADFQAEWRYLQLAKLCLEMWQDLQKIGKRNQSQLNLVSEVVSKLKEKLESHIADYAGGRYNAGVYHFVVRNIFFDSENDSYLGLYKTQLLKDVKRYIEGGGERTRLGAVLAEIINDAYGKIDKTDSLEKTPAQKFSEWSQGLLREWENKIISCLQDNNSQLAEEKFNILVDDLLKINAAKLYNGSFSVREITAQDREGAKRVFDLVKNLLDNGKYSAYRLSVPNLMTLNSLVVRLEIKEDLFKTWEDKLEIKKLCDEETYFSSSIRKEIYPLINYADKLSEALWNSPVREDVRELLGNWFNSLKDFLVDAKDKSTPSYAAALEDFLILAVKKLQWTQQQDETKITPEIQGKYGLTADNLNFICDLLQPTSRLKPAPAKDLSNSLFGWAQWLLSVRNYPASYTLIVQRVVENRLEYLVSQYEKINLLEKLQVDELFAASQAAQKLNIKPKNANKLLDLIFKYAFNKESQFYDISTAWSIWQHLLELYASKLLNPEVGENNVGRAFTILSNAINFIANSSFGDPNIISEKATANIVTIAKNLLNNQDLNINTKDKIKDLIVSVAAKNSLPQLLELCVSSNGAQTILQNRELAYSLTRKVVDSNAQPKAIIELANAAYGEDLAIAEKPVNQLFRQVLILDNHPAYPIVGMHPGTALTQQIIEIPPIAKKKNSFIKIDEKAIVKMVSEHPMLAEKMANNVIEGLLAAAQSAIRKYWEGVVSRFSRVFNAKQKFNQKVDGQSISLNEIRDLIVANPEDVAPKFFAEKAWAELKKKHSTQIGSFLIGLFNVSTQEISANNPRAVEKQRVLLEQILQHPHVLKDVFELIPVNELKGLASNERLQSFFLQAFQKNPDYGKESLKDNYVRLAFEFFHNPATKLQLSESDPVQSMQTVKNAVKLIADCLTKGVAGSHFSYLQQGGKFIHRFVKEIAPNKELLAQVFERLAVEKNADGSKLPRRWFWTIVASSFDFSKDNIETQNLIEGLKNYFFPVPTNRLTVISEEEADEFVDNTLGNKFKEFARFIVYLEDNVSQHFADSIRGKLNPQQCVENHKSPISVIPNFESCHQSARKESDAIQSKIYIQQSIDIRYLRP